MVWLYRAFLLLPLFGLFQGCAPASSSSPQNLTIPTQFEGPVENVVFIDETNERTCCGVQEGIALVNLYRAYVQEEFFHNTYFRSRFNLLERERTESILREQLLSDPLRFGRLLGAKYILLGSIVQLSIQDLTPGLRLPIIASVGNASITLNFALVDVQSGRKLASTTYVKRGLSVNRYNLPDLLKEAVKEALERLIKQLDE